MILETVAAIRHNQALPLYSNFNEPVKNKTENQVLLE